MQNITIFINSTGYCLSLGQKVLFEGISHGELSAFILDLTSLGFTVQATESGMLAIAA